MYLKSLELSGFKSFAKKTALDFTQHISAIVGPNGSGKSNVAEAFQFVLGEQSIKSLRGKRGEDMIWNGSRTLGRANRAAVKITLDNSKRLLNIDFDEVSIERVVHRPNNNEYIINGSQVRLKDIVELRSQAPMGPTGHHIISQGEADRILNANLRERRLMIEDALGLKVYQFKRAESDRKLLKTRENIAQVESLRRELAPHLRFLKKQVEKVEKVRQFKRELAELYREYLSHERVYLDFEREALFREAKEPRRKLEELEKELSKLKKTLEDSKSHDTKSSQVLAFEKQLREIRTQKDELTREAGRLEGELVSEERRIKKLEMAGATQDQRTVLLKEVKQLSSEITGRLSVIEKTEEISVIRSVLTEVKKSLQNFIARFESVAESGSLVEAEAEVKRIKYEREEFLKRINTITSQETEASKQYEHVRHEIEKEKDESRDAERDIFRIMSEQNELRATLNLLKGREDKLHLETQEFERESKEAVVLAGPEVVRDALQAKVDDAREERPVQQERRRQLEKLKVRLEEYGGSASDEMLKEYQDATDRDAFLEREVLDLEKSAESLSMLIKELTEKLDVEFREGVRKINEQFENFFRLMFGGGQAHLSVVRPEKRRHTEMDELLAAEAGEETPSEEEEIEEGIEIKVSLPHKKIRGLEVLSGGERALTSIALLFAISQVNPPPFIVLDETDAALDEANSRKYGDIIENLSKVSQLVLITHNRETMSRAGVLYGVTMGNDGVSKTLSIQFEDAVRVAK